MEALKSCPQMTVIAPRKSVLIQKMDNGECLRITNNGIKALGISSDEVKIALQILGLAITNSQGDGELSFTSQ
jgi:hypothetical protein